MIAVDTSAVIALLNPEDQFHDLARGFFENADGFIWLALNVTTHELFTRTRYNQGLREALPNYRSVRD